MSVEKIMLNDKADRWKWVCPNGHRSWEPTNHHFYCASCARAIEENIDSDFYEIENLATGEKRTRDQISLVEQIGSREIEYTG